MNQQPEPRPGDEDLAFFGRIGADVSHEMRNVLSVIGEVAGLLDDLVALAGKRKPLDLERVRKLSARITGQVRRGTETMERFSRFAHATDEPIASFDLAALAGNMALLAGRQAAMAGCKLEVELPDKPIPVRTRSFSLQRAVFSALQVILDSPEKGELIRLAVVAQGGEAVISFSASVAGDDADGELAGRISRLEGIAAELNGTVETTCREGNLSITLAVPIQ